MTSSAWLMGIVGVIYAGTVVSLYIEGQPYKALMFTGYVIAQVGIILDVILPSR